MWKVYALRCTIESLAENTGLYESCAQLLDTAEMVTYRQRGFIVRTSTLEAGTCWTLSRYDRAQSNGLGESANGCEVRDAERVDKWRVGKSGGIYMRLVVRKAARDPANS